MSPPKIKILAQKRAKLHIVKGSMYSLKHHQTLLTCLAKGKAETLARVYIDSDPTHSEADKQRISIQTVDRDQEPRQFRAAFPSWQEGMWGVNFNSFG